MKSILDLISDIGDLPRVLQQAYRCFRGKIDDVLAWNLRSEAVRVPLHIHRYGVKMAPWWTCDVVLVNISSRPGLLEVCSNLEEWRTRTSNRPTDLCPVLCDVDLYFRLHILHYTVTYASVSSAPFFAKTPLLFGMWHAYKYCMTECYRQFLPLWAALEYKQFLNDPTKVELLTNLNLSMMESMVLSMFLCTNRVVPLIRSTIAELRCLQDVRGAGTVKFQQLQGMLALFRNYAPALWYLGYWVRTLHWHRHDP